jgi:hypothetical protein
MNNNNPENRIQYYIQYLSSWFYHNVLYTETAAVLLKIIVFVILLSLLVYQQYYYFAAGAAGVTLVSVYLFLRPGGAAEGPGAGAEGPWPWPGHSMMDNSVRRVDKDELTIGVPLVKEGFSIAMPKIIKGDDSGKDYRRSNKFIEEDSRDFTEKYFNSKKCGIGSGIGGITMFGSNELISGERTVALSGLYNFAGNWGGERDINESTPAINEKRYKYFKDCVFIPVKKSVDNNGADFRDIKKNMFANINTKIINISGVLDRFDTTLLFTTETDPNADYSKRISLSSNPGNTGNIAYKSLIAGGDNKTKLVNIQPLYNSDSINDKTYADLLTSIHNDRVMTSSVRQRHLEVYAKVYEYRKKIDNILANMRAQTKDDASLLYTVRVSESVVNELRLILSYLLIIQRTNDIIQFETHIGVGNNGSIYNLAPIGLPASYEMGAIRNTEGAYKSKIVGANNIFKIPLEDDTYNNNDEKRYVYGITYYFDTKNSSNIAPIVY